MRKLHGLWKNRKRQRGNALVMVIIAIAFIGMLVAMIVYSAYGNFLMKFNDYRAKDNFYTAESVMDIINAGMQVDISDCMLDSYAYATSLSNEEVTDSAMTREAIFRDKFATLFKEKIQLGSDSTKWDVDYFIAKYENGSGESVASSAGAKGAYIEAGPVPNLAEGETTNVIVTAADLLTFKNIRVTYTNQGGYVSVIQTDIRVKVPEMKTVQPQKNVTLQDYCLIANDHLYSDTNYTFTDVNNDVHAGGPSSVQIGGNVNAGKYGLEVGKGSTVSFENATGETGAQEYYLVMNDMNVASDTDHIVKTNENYITFVNDIKVNTSKIDLNGVVYAADDLDVTGKNSQVKLRGRYYGYGNNSNNSSESSSFLINGANSTIDTSGLTEMILAGNTFIGATSYDADTRRYDGVYGNGEGDKDDEILDIESYKKELVDKNLYPQENDPETIVDPTTHEQYHIVPMNDSDLLMGGSIGAKAEQMLYLIPSDCVGYDHKSQEPYLCKNPMTKAEFDTLKNSTYTDESGEHPTYDIINVAKLNSLGYTNNYKAIYRRVNGTVLVYLYIDFGNSETDAANFLKNYYTNNREELKDYIEPYYNKVTSRIGTNLLEKSGEEYTNLYVQGNFFYYDASGELQMIDGNISSSANNSARVLDMCLLVR